MKNKLLIHTLDTYKNVTEDFKKNSFINYKYTETLLDEDINILKEMTKESYDLITGLIEINSEASNNYLKYLKESIKEYKFIKDSKSKVKEYFFNIVKKELIIGSDNVYVKVNGKNHTLDKLSHGERQLITFLVFLDYVGKKKDLILIDEPCISLDTDWQEKLVSIFSSICPNSEFILTTHSPYLSINHMKSIRNIDILE
jgi:predicted ATPase